MSLHFFHTVYTERYNHTLLNDISNRISKCEHECHDSSKTIIVIIHNFIINY